MARFDLIRDAERPKMNARALFQGPQGSGKTWTMLSVAHSLTKGTKGRILGIDTERESMLTYADVFSFKHLPWRPPYSPDELTQTLDKIATGWVETADDVVLIDSSSHFWQGSGGILDIANGRVQGGWDKARPLQNALVEQFLAMPCHLLLGARMKNSVLVSDNGKTIENVGLTIIQDDTLGYELNIVVQMDMQHNISVMKSRTPAVPVGRMYPGGSEGKLAEDYAEWLAGGVPPANREDVEAIVELFGNIADKDQRKALKDSFVEEFGMPHSLTAEQVPAARAWLSQQGAAIGEGPAAGAPAPSVPNDPDADTPEGGPDGPDELPTDPAPNDGEGQAPAGESEPAARAREKLAEQVAEHEAATATAPDPDEWVDFEQRTRRWADDLKGQDLQAELEAEQLTLSGSVAARRDRLVEHLIAKAKAEAGIAPDTDPGTEAF